jgi:hypothetical protein
MNTPFAGPVWLQGPIDGVPPLLQPVAHALLEARDDVAALMDRLTHEDLWSRPGGAASVGFHLRHCMGSLDRLFTYARGEPLNAAQLATLASEKTLDGSAGTSAQITADFTAAVERAIGQLRATPADMLLAPRAVGRAKLPSNVVGLLAHAGDHTYRHVGQAITTAKIVDGLKA